MLSVRGEEMPDSTVENWTPLLSPQPAPEEPMDLQAVEQPSEPLQVRSGGAVGAELGWALEHCEARGVVVRLVVLMSPAR